MDCYDMTIRALHAVVTEGNDKELETGLKIMVLRRELDRLESDYIGAREQAAKAKEVLRVAIASCPIQETFSREIEIARMRGFELAAGEPLTEALKARLYPRIDYRR
jgi:hypothetical protein